MTPEMQARYDAVMNPPAVPQWWELLSDLWAGVCVRWEAFGLVACSTHSMTFEDCAGRRA